MRPSNLRMTPAALLLPVARPAARTVRHDIQPPVSSAPPAGCADPLNDGDGHRTGSAERDTTDGYVAEVRHSPWPQRDTPMRSRGSDGRRTRQARVR